MEMKEVERKAHEITGETGQPKENMWSIKEERKEI
jgi:hypothetical protein